jgi:uncharacterized membrane protein HdeD (DUF308 family)
MFNVDIEKMPYIILASLFIFLGLVFLSFGVQFLFDPGFTSGTFTETLILTVCGVVLVVFPVLDIIALTKKEGTWE